MIIFAIFAIILGIFKIITSFSITGNLGKRLLNYTSAKISENDLMWSGLFEGIDGIIELLLGIYIIVFI